MIPRFCAWRTPGIYRLNGEMIVPWGGTAGLTTLNVRPVGLG